MLAYKQDTVTINKHNGVREPFSDVKLLASVDAAVTAGKTELAEDVRDDLLVRARQLADTNAIAAAVEETLTTHAPAAADAYHQYRGAKLARRQQAQDLDAALNRLQSRDRNVVNENANKDSEVFNTQRDLTAGTVARAQGLKMLPPAVAVAT